MLALLLALFAPAHAAEWSDFADAFPTLPCSDGWAGCIVGDSILSAEPVRARDGVPTPADLRLGWFTLDGQPAFDPFAELSVYSGPPREQEVATLTRSEPTAPTQEVIRTEPVTRTVSTPVEPVDCTDDCGTTAPTTKVIETAPEPVVAAPARAANTQACGPVDKIQSDAMMGKLSPDVATCLESVAGTAPKQTERSKASRVLISQARSARDTEGWARLVKRHLDEIERSDPDIALRYALHLNRQGGDPGAIIRWSDVALENRHLWTGTAYTRNTLRLRELKSIAAATRWQALEKKVADGVAVDPAARQRARTDTVTFAREWYDYAASAGAKTDRALALCVSAAGTDDACR